MLNIVFNTCQSRARRISKTLRYYRITEKQRYFCIPLYSTKPPMSRMCALHTHVQFKSEYKYSHLLPIMSHLL